MSLPLVSEWITSTNCASVRSSLPSGGSRVNEGPAGSSPK